MGARGSPRTDADTGGGAARAGRGLEARRLVRGAGSASDRGLRNGVVRRTRSSQGTTAASPGHARHRSAVRDRAQTPDPETTSRRRGRAERSAPSPDGARVSPRSHRRTRAAFALAAPAARSDLADPDAGVAEDPHPGAVLAPGARVPGELHG